MPYNNDNTDETSSDDSAGTPLPPSERFGTMNSENTADNSSSSTQSNDQSGDSRTGRVKTRRRMADQSTDEEETTSESESDSVDVCSECTGDVKHNQKRGETACEDCGLVIDEKKIDRGPEWRAFNSKERGEKSRVGNPVDKMMHDDGLSTNIDWRDKDGYGNSLNSKQRKKMKRLRKWNERSKTQDAKERNLRQALGEINRMASTLGIPRDIRKIGSMVYRQALDQDLLPGRSIEGVATASLYAATRIEGIPRSLSEMASVSRVGEEEIGRTYRYIDRELSLGIGPSDPVKYIPRFLGDLDGMSQETERLARRLVELVKENELQSGKTPPGIAAAAIYMAGQLTNEASTQSDLADVTGVTEVTIRERYQDMINHGDEEWLHG